MLGKIHSFQSLGTLDGPGIRFVVFTKGCNLRCSCCHNPDTWDTHDAKEYEPSEIIKKVVRYKEYFKSEGGITVSGGEPLLQPKFVKELFILAHKENINTCLDTSGSILNEDVKDLLKHVDHVLLDIKYTKNELYNKYVGCNLNDVLGFLKYLDEIVKRSLAIIGFCFTSFKKAHNPSESIPDSFMKTFECRLHNSSISSGARLGIHLLMAS